MTTGNKAIQYVSLRPNENTRSIVEIKKEVLNNGYDNLTKEEIDNLIEWERQNAIYEYENERLKDENALSITLMGMHINDIKENGLHGEA